MSRRESCVWHPMPEEVRRSSVQSRRASLAAGRRKSQQASNNQPDWEVEAPPTPPPAEDYHPRPAVTAATTTTSTSAAQSNTAPTASKAAASDEYPTEAKETTRQEDGIYPTEANANEEEEGVYPTEANTNEEEPKSYPTEEPQEAARESTKNEEEEPRAGDAARNGEHLRGSDKEAEVLTSSESTDAHDTLKQKTRHTIRFRGDGWKKLVSKKPDAIKAAFLKDIWIAAKVKEEDACKLQVGWDGRMVVTFVSFHTKGLKKRQQAIHELLREYAFPNVCALYPFKKEKK